MALPPVTHHLLLTLHVIILFILFYLSLLPFLTVTKTFPFQLRRDKISRWEFFLLPFSSLWMRGMKDESKSGNGLLLLSCWKEGMKVKVESGRVGGLANR